MSRSIDDILNEMESCIDQWEAAAALQAALDANYKSGEAAQKLALMDSGESGVKAENQVRSSPKWKKLFVDLQMQNICVEKANRQIKLLQNRFEAARTAAADARRVI